MQLLLDRSIIKYGIETNEQFKVYMRMCVLLLLTAELPAAPLQLSVHMAEVLTQRRCQEWVGRNSKT